MVPLDGSVPADVRDTHLSGTAGVPVTLAGTVVDQTPAIASNAVKSGYDAAQRIAALLTRGATESSTENKTMSLNGAAS